MTEANLSANERTTRVREHHIELRPSASQPLIRWTAAMGALPFANLRETSEEPEKSSGTEVPERLFMRSVVRLKLREALN